MNLEFYVKVRDGAQQIADACQEQIESMEPKEAPKYNMENVAWTKETGSKGPYERATDQDSADFRALVNDLEAHDGKLQRDGFFIWKFSTGNSVGRKPAKR